MTWLSLYAPEVISQKRDPSTNRGLYLHLLLHGGLMAVTLSVKNFL